MRTAAPANDATATGSLGGSDVEPAGEVFQAAVDLGGDHAVAGTKPAGDLQRGDEVGAGRGAGEYPLGAGGPPDSTADSPGSTTARWSAGAAAASARLTPRKQPAVPT